MAELTCPKCQSDMRSYERSGVTVDQCTGCRGVFLDRGELERLVDAEGSFYESGDRQEERPERERPERRDNRDYRDDDDDDDHRRRDPRQQWGGGKHGRKKKKEGFLSDFLDFG